MSPNPRSTISYNTVEAAISQFETVSVIRSAWVTWQLERTPWIGSTSLKSVGNAGEQCKINLLEQWKYTWQSLPWYGFYTVWLFLCNFRSDIRYSSLHFVPRHLLHISHRLFLVCSVVETGPYLSFPVRIHFCSESWLITQYLCSFLSVSIPNRAH